MIFYISSKENRYKLRKVIIDGYRDHLIIGGFRGRTQKAGFELSQKYKTYEVYNCLPSIEFVAETLLPSFEILPNEPIKLKDYLIEYGYDYKSKTIDGLTLNKHVKQYMRMK